MSSKKRWLPDPSSVWTRRRLLWAAESIALFLLLLVVGTLIDEVRAISSGNGRRVLETDASWVIALILLGTGWYAAQIFRFERIWLDLKPALLKPASGRDEAERSIANKGLSSLFAYLGLSLITLITIAYAPRDLFGLLPFEIHVQQPGNLETCRENGDCGNELHLQVYLLFVIASFIPLSWAFYRQASSSRRPLWRRDAVSAETILTTVGLLSLIAGLAWAAGNGLFQLNNDTGTLVTVLVILAFILMIVAPQLSRLLNFLRDSPAEKQQIQAAGVTSLPLHLVSYIDSAIVRIIAPLSGATQNIAPHFLVLTIIILLATIGYVLASPYGLVPIFFAMLLAIALGRRWAWVEDDRETAVRLRSTESDEIKIGFDNDLKDEALLGYASLFILVPLALYQIQSLTGAFERNDEFLSGIPLLDWVRFFGAELAKGVPFVDWFEIYDIDVDVPYEIGDQGTGLARHLTFTARALVDVVIIAALLQAIGIWQSSRTQKRLYRSGHLDAFDPFTERSFFEHGVIKRKNQLVISDDFRKAVGEHARNWRKLHGETLPYSRQRLDELIHSDNADVNFGANWMVNRYDILAGSPNDKIARLVQFWTEREVFTVKDISDDDLPGYEADFTTFRRDEKLRLESILQEIISEKQGTYSISLETNDLQNLTLLAGLCGDAPEFQYARLLILEIMAQNRADDSAEAAILGLVAQAIDGNVPSRLDPTIKDQVEAFIPSQFRDYNGFELRFAVKEARVNVYSQLEILGTGIPNDRPFMPMLESFLLTMEKADPARNCKAAAKKARLAIFPPKSTESKRPN